MDLTGRQLGPYQIEREIGRGGMSVIYLATDTRTGEQVALKVLLPHLVHDPVTLRRFQQEGENASRLIHPNIVRVFEAGVIDGHYYIAMEYAARGTIASLLRARAQPMRVQEALPLLRRVAAALDYAHNRGILHRDIKPNNVLIGGNGQVLLSDFGVARHLSTDYTVVTMTGYSVGTPAYMSPEQARGDFDLDQRSDIYSLGVVAYAMLTHTLPFDAESQLVLLRKIIDEPPTPPEQVNAGLPPGVCYALQRVLAKAPQQRFATASDFVEALETGLSWTPTPRDWRTLNEAPVQAGSATSTASSNRRSVTPPSPLPAQRQRGRAMALLLGIGALGLVAVAFLLLGSGANMAAYWGLMNNLLSQEATATPAALVVISPPTATMTAQVASVKTITARVIPTATATALPPTLAPTPVMAVVQSEPTERSALADGAATTTARATATATPMAAIAPTATALPSATATHTATHTATETPTSSAVATLPPTTLPTSTPDGAATATTQAWLIATSVAQTLTALPTATPTKTATSSATPTLLPSATPSATPSPAPTATDTATPRPTSTPVPVATATPTPDWYLTLTAIDQQLTALAPFLTPTVAATATPVPLPTNTPAPTAALAPTKPAQPGLITGFEPLGNWQRGAESYGALTQSQTQVAEGAYAAELRYDFPAAAGNRNYVVFLASPPLRLANDTNALQLQVYGDQSGHYLNFWLNDAAGHTWQFTFGQIRHNGWAVMNASFALDQPWPVSQLEGSETTQLASPLYLKALVLDGVPDGVASTGVIYLDALATANGNSSAPQANPPPNAPVASPTAGNSAPAADAVAPINTGARQGRIAYSIFNGRTMDVYVYNLADGSRWPHLANKRQPDFSRGGILLLNGDGGGVNDITRISPSGNEEGVTMHPEDAHPQWSQSSQSIVYASTHQGDGKSRIYWQRDASGRFDSPPLAYSGRELFGKYPVYLDNWRIAYQGCNVWAGGSSCGIYTADTNGGAPNQATDQTADIPTDSLGSQVLFMSNRGGNWDVYVVNWDGSGLTRLTDHPGRDGQATASPDFQQIAFVSDRDGGWAVYVMNRDGSNQQKLFDLNGGYGGGDYDWLQERLSWGP
ncbi:MAG: protein kinase [Caldilineaceae bacterium]